MQENNEFDEQTLGAFIDGQLDAQLSESIILAMEKHTDIRQRVYELRRCKDLMRIGFADASLQNKIKPSGIKWNRYAIASVASLAAIILSLGSGVSGYYYGAKSTHNENTPEATVKQKSERILLHISESNIEHFSAALNYVDNFLKQHESTDAQIAVIANAGGLDLIRSGTSPFENKIIKIMSQHSNVHFIACANSVRNLQKKGIEFQLIDQVRLNKPAMDHIIEYIQGGWTYKKVNTLTKL